MQPAEAILLGFASGPACLSSCGPVLAPLLTAAGQPVRRTLRNLAVFLGGRFFAYAAFGVLAWAAGSAVPPDAATRATVFGAAHLAIAGLLAWSALPLRKTACEGCRACRPAAPAALGLLTGLSLCPPFLAAAARAAGTGTLALSVAWFCLFFVGTAVWFLPLAALGLARRLEAATTVARIAMLILAAYYGCLGVLALAGRLLHA